jgi:hypothetical protein
LPEKSFHLCSMFPVSCGVWGENLKLVNDALKSEVKEMRQIHIEFQLKTNNNNGKHFLPIFWWKKTHLRLAQLFALFNHHQILILRFLPLRQLRLSEEFLFQSSQQQAACTTMMFIQTIDLYHGKGPIKLRFLTLNRNISGDFQLLQI